MMEAQQEEERMQMTARTVGELIDILSQLPADSIPISIEPPFTGVSVVPQDGDNTVLFCRIEKGRENGL